MNLIFLGPPGAGKGTQAQRICWEYDIAQISTGDLLRSHIAKGTKIGQEADKYIHKGNLVPDELIIEMIKDELSETTNSEGFILDGFPRTVPQAEELDRVLVDIGKKIDVVLVLEVPKEDIIPRLTARRTCPQCGKSYHLIFNPPAIDGVCDLDGGALYQRKDDNEETVLHRQKVYEESTKPIIAYYEKQDLVKRVDGLGRLEKVYDRIKSILNSVRQE